MKKKIIIFANLFLLILLAIVAIILQTKNNNITNNEINTGKENFEIEKSKMPTIPEGFHPVKVNENDWINENGMTNNWNNGLVIEDTKGNQFVWVPCNLEGTEDIVKFARYFYNSDTKKVETCDTNDYISFYGNNIGEPNLEDINELKNSISRYGGFYIGRFEVGQENGQAVIKKNAKAWNNINYNDAKKIADNFYNENIVNVKSGLCNSYIYDTTSSWLYNNFKDYKPYDYLNRGNFTGKECLTGEDESLYFKNIADLYGNLFEFTTERDMANDIIQRGLGYNFTRKRYEEGKSIDILYDRVMCFVADSEFKNDLIGFRIFLYLN